MSNESERIYLGDGVSAAWCNGDLLLYLDGHRPAVVLEPATLAALLEYVARVKGEEQR